MTAGDDTSDSSPAGGGTDQSVSDGRFRFLLQQMPGFVAVLSGPEHVYEYVNDAFVAIVGPRKIVGLSVRNALPELAGQGYFELLDQVYSTGVPFTAKAMPLRMAGEDEDRYIDLLYQAIRDDRGSITGIFIGGYDTTERVRTHVSQETLVRLTDTIKDLTDPDDVAFEASRILGETLRVSRVGYGTIDSVAETLQVTRDWNAPGVETLAGTLPLRAYGSFIDSLKRGEFISINNVDKDERTIEAAEALKSRSAFSFINFPVIEKGQLVAVFFINHGAVREWTAFELALVREFGARTRSAVERNRNEQALRDLNVTLEQRVDAASSALRLYENIVQSNAAPICAFDTEYRLIAFNKAHSDEFYRIYGYRVQLGDVFPNLFLPDQAKIMRAFMTRALTGEIFTITQEFGDPKLIVPYWEVAYSPLHDDDGRIIGAFHYAVDITARLRAQAELIDVEEALRQSQKMEAVGQLTGGLAHDFNNLLTGMMGNLELLQTRLARGKLDNLDRFVTAAQGAGRRATALTQRLLAFSRRQTLDPRPTDVNRLVDGMEEMLRRTVGGTMEIEIVGAAGLWTANIDAGQLENGLLNLCINARDAMPDGGRITIETANRWLDDRAAKEREVPPGQYLSICVSDTGTGMSAQAIAKAFEPFYTTKPIGQGTGLGLSMVYGFARQSGGQVRIYSEVGQGTTVCIYLPRHLGDAESADERDAVRGASTVASGQTVLVVDDEPTIRHLIDEVLGEAGYTVIDASDGSAGIKILQSGARIELLITDVGLPNGMNGRQVADAARAIRPGLKVLFITGYAENAAVGNGHLEPGMELLTKPFAMDALASKVEEMLRSVTK